MKNKIFKWVLVAVFVFCLTFLVEFIIKGFRETELWNPFSSIFKDPQFTDKTYLEASQKRFKGVLHPEDEVILEQLPKIEEGKIYFYVFDKEKNLVNSFLTGKVLDISHNNNKVLVGNADNSVWITVGKDTIFLEEEGFSKYYSDNGQNVKKIGMSDLRSGDLVNMTNIEKIGYEYFAGVLSVSKVDE